MQQICKDCQGLIAPCFLTLSCEHCSISLSKAKLYVAYCLKTSNNQAVLFEDLQNVEYYANQYNTDKTFLKVGSFYDFSAAYVLGDAGPFLGRKFSNYTFNVVQTHKCAAIREHADDFVFVLEEITGSIIQSNAM